MSKARIRVKHNSPDLFGIRGARARAWLPLLCVLLGLLAGPLATAQPHAKNVLFVFSTVKYSGETLGAIEPYIRAHVPGPVNFYYAYLDDSQSSEIPYWETLAETVRRKYAGIKTDVVIADGTGPLIFAMNYRDKIFPGVPIVFVAVNQRELEGQNIWPQVTGVTHPLGFRETIDLALRLEPDTKAIAVVTGPTQWESFWLAAMKSELARYQDRVKEIDLVGIPNRQMLQRVSALPPRTVVMFMTSPQYSNEPDFGAWDLLRETAQRVPTYSVWPRFCVNGCIGGAFEDYVQAWRSTADLASRVLSGQRAEDLPIEYPTDLHVRVDWLALQRWHIPESALPPGAIILNRPPSIWQSYRNYIIAALAVFVAQAVLILGLLWQRARKRKAEAVALESETRFRVMADTTPALVWMCDAQGVITYLNDRRVAFTGRDPRAGFGDTWTTYIHPDDRKKVQDQQTQAMKDKRSFSKEYRLRRSDGVYRWMLDVAAPRIDGQGAFAGFIGSAIDVTDQKLAQESLEKLSGQLIEAQEKERTRIARDIHDDICQRLVLLSMELDQANRPANVSPAGKRELAEVRKHCAGIVEDLRSLSHELHSSTLDYLGIVPAIRGHCQEVARQHEVTVEFTDEDVPQHLSADVSLCLFRVAQEALHNAVKYSGAKRFKVDVRKVGSEIQLQVSDDGAGFDGTEAKQTGGLGLVSMQERINQVHGSLHIESTRGTGTRILAAVPIVVEEAIPLEENIARETTSTLETK